MLARKESRPPKQKPIVKTARTRWPPHPDPTGLPEGPEHVDGGLHVPGQVRVARLAHVGHEVEVGRPLPDADPGGPPEVVDRERVHARLGEAERQLLVVRVQAADVRQDDDGRPRGGLGAGKQPGEAPAVAGPEDHLLAVDCAAGHRLDRRPAVEVEAHGHVAPGWQVGSGAAESGAMVAALRQRAPGPQRPMVTNRGGASRIVARRPCRLTQMIAGPGQATSGSRSAARASVVRAG